MFNVVTFPNEPCDSNGDKNGTCNFDNGLSVIISLIICIFCGTGYTKEECSDLGGIESGTCASGFGICCICK